MSCKRPALLGQLRTSTAQESVRIRTSSKQNAKLRPVLYESKIRRHVISPSIFFSGLVTKNSWINLRLYHGLGYKRYGLSTALFWTSPDIPGILFCIWLPNSDHTLSWKHTQLTTYLPTSCFHLIWIIFSAHKNCPFAHNWFSTVFSQWRWQNLLRLF